MVEYKDDFYNFVNKKWLDKMQIPNDKGAIGTFTNLQDNTLKKIKKLIENPNSDVNYNKINIIYKQGLSKRDCKKDFQMINRLLSKIDDVQNINELFTLALVYNARFGITLPFSLDIGASYNNSKMNILYCDTHGLGLDKVHYNDPDIVSSYKVFLNSYIKKFNLDVNIDSFYNIELQLANVSYSHQDERNIEKNNNHLQFNDFIIRFPNLSFIKYFFTICEKDPGELNVGNLEYFKHLNSLITNDNLQIWKEYLKLKFILDQHLYLTNDIYMCYFDFFQKQIHGIKEPEPLWKKSLIICEHLMGDLIGELYIKQYFSIQAKQHAYEMVTFIIESIRTMIKSNWMENKTKEHAIDKLDKMHIKIGYPDKLDKDYSKLQVSSDKSYIENIWWCNIFIHDYNRQYLYKPVNPKLWHMSAYEINAYYSPSSNDIVFPAGILQAPFFTYNDNMSPVDIANNFGGIGSVISHEITHGFDDQGCKFDGNGNLNNWWTDADKEHYKKLANSIINQYSKYTIDNNHINGELTLGENIADIGGVQISYNAFIEYLKKNPQYNKNVNNVKPGQRFFINYAKIWRKKYRKEYIKDLLISDPHAPGIFRVNGVLRNIDSFYDNFNIVNGDQMFLNKDLRSRIW
jgi:putative endopeptidase